MPSECSMQRQRAIAATRSFDIIKRYILGVAIKDICDLHECTRNTVLRYARLAGLPKRPKGFSDKIRKTTIIMYKNGKPIAEISAALGVSQAYISKTATEEGINRRVFK